MRGRSLNIKEVVPNYYAALGLKPDATLEDVKEHYRALAWELHPDRGGNAAKMAAVTEAYSVLKNVKRRKEYDKKLDLVMTDCGQCKGTGRKYVKKGFKKEDAGACGVCEGRGKMF